MKFLYFTFIICLLFTTACKDDEYHTIIEGQVINEGSKLPIDSILVLMQDGVGHGGGWFDLGGTTSSDKKSYTYTNSEGRFQIELIGELRAIIGFKKEHYAFEPDGNGYDSYPDGSFSNQIFEMRAYAWFNGVFINFTPSFKDSMYIADKKYERYDREYDWNEEIFFTGKGPFQPYKSYGSGAGNSTLGHHYFRFKLRFTRNGQWITKIDSVFIKSLETYTDTIYY